MAPGASLVDPAQGAVSDHGTGGGAGLAGMRERVLHPLAAWRDCGRVPIELSGPQPAAVAVSWPGWISTSRFFRCTNFSSCCSPLIGALGVLTLRIRSRMATGALVWSALAVAFYLWTPARSPAFVLQMIVPMALLGALLIESLHHTFAWSIIRYPLAVLALLAL